MTNVYLLFLADRYKLSDMSCFSNVNAMPETLTLILNHVFESRKLVIQNFGVLRELLLVRSGHFTSNRLVAVCC